MSIVSVFEDESNRKKAQRWSGRQMIEGYTQQQQQQRIVERKIIECRPITSLLNLLGVGKTLFSVCFASRERKRYV